MLDPDYVLDSELDIDVGQLPSAVQVQALTEALTRLRRRFLPAQALLTRKMAPLDKAPIDGLSPRWQKRLRAEMDFIEAAYVQLQRLAAGYVRFGGENAAVAGDWNRWNSQVLSVFAETVKDFEGELSRAMSNSVVSGVPAGFIKTAHLAKMNPPALEDVKPVSLSGLDETPKPLLLVGAALGAAAVAWWYNRRNG